MLASSGRSTSFKLHDVPSKQPVPYDQRAVDVAGGGVPSRFVDTPAQLDEAREIEWLVHVSRPIRLRWDSTLPP